MAYRFKARSTTPGQYRLAAGTLAQLIAVSNIVDGVGRGDGGVGEYPTTAATQAADAATLTGTTLDATGNDTIVAFGASNGTAGTSAVWVAASQVQATADAAALTTATLDATGDDTTISFAPGIDGTAKSGAVFTAGQADQLGSDQAAVAGASASINNDVTILTVPGTQDLAAIQQASYNSGYSNGQTDQYVSDCGLLETNKDEISADDTQIASLFGVTGTYPTTEITNAAHLAADKAFLNANLDEMIEANDSIRAQYDCSPGEAVGGGGGTYPDTDEVDGGVIYGPTDNLEGTGVNATTIRAALGLASANLDTQLSNIQSAVSASAGTGAYTLHITVTDGTDPLEGAKVRMTKGAESYIATTDALGRANGAAGVGRDAGTWAVAITLPLYTFTPTTIAVTVDASQTYTMSAVSIPASNAEFKTGYLYCYDENGAVENSVTVQIQMIGLPGTGLGLDTAIRSGTSDATGLVSFTNLTPGASYRMRRGTTGQWKDITVTDDDTSPFALPNVFG